MLSRLPENVPVAGDVVEVGFSLAPFSVAAKMVLFDGVTTVLVSFLQAKNKAEAESPITRMIPFFMGWTIKLDKHQTT